LPLSGGQPLVLITLGSTLTDDVNFFVNAAHAATRAGALVIVAYGDSELAPGLKEKLAVRLPRCIAVRWVDYAHLFPRLSAIIHHGGVGTTHAAVVHGVPQVIVPHGGDQGLQAVRAEACGVGLDMPPDQATVDRLRQAIEMVLFDSDFRVRARNLASAFAALGGVTKAADVLEQM
jgi:UDP:flavonoid glycosyltransferase YjiC (YdhE family)